MPYMHKLIKLFFLLLVIMVVSGHDTHGQNRRLERAERAFELQQYHEAIDLYRRVLDRLDRSEREKTAELTFKLALCYSYTNNHRMAESWFRRAIRIDYPDPVAYLYMAQAKMYNEKYEEARETFKTYMEKVPDDWRGPRGLASIELAMELREQYEDYDVEPVRLFNSPADDMTPAYGDHRGTTLIFASSRDDALGRDEDPWTGNKHSSFFITHADRAGNWDRPSLLDEGPINTEYNEGAPSVNATATEMFFTRCTRAEDVSMGCRIFRARRDGANWTNPQEVPLTEDSLVTVGHPAISPDELDLYFVSNMPGSIGERDIWVVSRSTPNDEFGPPENLGEVINTKGNEMFPYVHEDGSLYFSSDGHPGMGGLDIFRTTYRGGEWSEPENLGPPFNSAADDFGIVYKPGREEGFFSSNRGRRGIYDIYSFYQAPVEFRISGTVVDDSTQTAVANANVQLVGSDGSLVQQETESDGTFLFDETLVRENTDYEILVNKTGYFSARTNETTRGLERSHEFELEMGIAPIPVTAIELPEILYEFDSWELQTQFKDSLNGLVQTLEDNPHIVIELASHTDSRGTHEYNDTLSLRRAEAVVDYLVEQGIENERIEAAGYGKRAPRVLERDVERNGYLFEEGTELTEEFIEALESEEMQEIAHQMNRRTEFRVLREDYEPPPEEETEEAEEVTPMEETERSEDLREEDMRGRDDQQERDDLPAGDISEVNR